MPIQIIRENIVEIKCDAMVNPTDSFYSHGGGVDKAIHSVAGAELSRACAELGAIQVGEAKLTLGYNLPCKYVIHTVGPVWRGGIANERKNLESCYVNSLSLAKENGCKSVAIPLISSGRFGYPKDQVLKLALSVIKEFLDVTDMLVYLVVYDKESYEISKKVQGEITKYINKNYKPEPYRHFMSLAKMDCGACLAFGDEPEEELDEYDDSDFKPRKAEKKCYPGNVELRIPRFGSIGSIKKVMYHSFSDTLFEFLDQKGIDPVDCYKRANVSRQTWHKIVSDEDYQPTKNTAISLAISLKLTLRETQRLLETAGFILSKSSIFDVIIMFCIINEIYDVLEIDSILFQYDQDVLFSKR